MLLFHEVYHSSKIYLLIDGLKLENEILKEVGSNESYVFACLSTISFPWILEIIMLFNCLGYNFNIYGTFEFLYNSIATL